MKYRKDLHTAKAKALENIAEQTLRAFFVSQFTFEWWILPFRFPFPSLFSLFFSIAE